MHGKGSSGDFVPAPLALRQRQEGEGDVFSLELWILHVQMARVVMLIAVDLYLLFHISQRHSSGSQLLLLQLEQPGEPFRAQSALWLPTNPHRGSKHPPWLHFLQGRPPQRRPALSDAPFEWPVPVKPVSSSSLSHSETVWTPAPLTSPSILIRGVKTIRIQI